MTEQDLLFTTEEEQELRELEKKGNKLTIIKKILVVLMSCILLVILYGSLVLFPFKYKVSGEWNDLENAMYQIRNEGTKSDFKIKQLTGNPNLSLIIKGDIYSVGSNRYKTKNNQPYLEVNKKGIANETIDELKNQTESYEIISDTDEKLILKYTEEAKETSFPDNQLEELFYYELSPSYYPRQTKVLKLRNSTFANPTILFNK